MKRIIYFAVVFMSSVVLLKAEEPAPAPTKPWKNESELSAVSANGNTRSSSFSGKDTFGYKWTQTALELVGAGMGSKSQGVTTAENYTASEKFAYSIDERNYVFEKGTWNKDRFAGINNRYEETLGLGRALMVRPHDLLIAELGGGYTTEERKNQKTNSFASGRAYSKYTRTISATAKFSQDVEYLHDFDDPDDFRMNTETAITAALSTHFSLKTAYLWKHVGRPPTGFGRNDTTTSVALIAVY